MDARGGPGGLRHVSRKQGDSHAYLFALPIASCAAARRRAGRLLHDIGRCRCSGAGSPLLRRPPYARHRRRDRCYVTGESPTSSSSRAARATSGINVPGAIVGGVAGAWPAVPSSGGRDAATVLGGAAGAAIGSQVGRSQTAIGTDPAYRVTIQTDPGALRTYDVPATRRPARRRPRARRQRRDLSFLTRRLPCVPLPVVLSAASAVTLSAVLAACGTSGSLWAQQLPGVAAGSGGHLSVRHLPEPAGCATWSTAASPTCP